MVENNLCTFIWSNVNPATPMDPLAPENAEDNTYVYFRDKVKIDAESSTNLRLEVCCYSDCEIYFNGKYLGKGSAPCSYKYPIVDVYDLTGKEISGDNIIAALCYFDSRYYRIWWADPKDVPYSKPGFFFRLISTKNGKEEVVMQSGTNTKAHLCEAWLRSTPRISLVYGFVEVFDDSKAEKSFEQLNYDDSSWKPSIETFSLPANNLHKSEIAMLDIVKETDYQVIDVSKLLGNVDITPDCIKINASNPSSFPSVTLDFGRIIVGYPELDIESEGEGILTLSFGEILNLKPMNRVLLNADTKNYRSFGRRAFRYMKIEAHSSLGEIRIKNINVKRPKFPALWNGEFSGPESLTNIWKTAKYTLELGMQDHYEDSIWRERILWLGDMYMCGLSNYFTAGAYNYDRKCLVQLAALQQDDGAVPSFGPRENTSSILGDYVCLFPATMLNYYTYSGDMSILEQLHECLNKLVVWFESISDESGRVDLCGAGDDYIPSPDSKYVWFIDWNRKVVEKKYSGAMFYIYGLGCLSEIFEILGDIDQKMRVSNLKNHSQEFYKDIPFELRSATIATLSGYKEQASLIAKEALEMQIQTGYFNGYICHILIKNGYRKEALELITKYWSGMLNRGATTFWEEFDYYSAPHTVPKIDTNFDWSAIQSCCHAWSSVPCFLIPYAIWGIEPLTPGFAEFGVKPFLDFEFDKISSTIPTPSGDIRIDCKKENNKAQIEINHPEKLICRFDFSLINIPTTVSINEKCL